MRTIAIATMTHDGRGEPNLQRASLAALAEQGHRAYIADGGSSHSFLDYARQLGHHIESTEPGPYVQQRQALHAARDNADGVLWTEPDKVQFIDERLEGVLNYCQTAPGAVVVARSAAAFSTFHFRQRQLEEALNQQLSDDLGIEGDFTYGPKFFLSSCIDLPEELEPGEHGGDTWGALYFLLGATTTPITLIEEGCACPDDKRTSFDFYGHRATQIETVYKGFLRGAGRELPISIIISTQDVPRTPNTAFRVEYASRP
ncbi:MAG: hypothetical protein OXR66_08940 [Candidatus Woesearchaeota archaeon]|nr:hypothetical protein [Candidatus Woesearchaeota archaeon]